MLVSLEKAGFGIVTIPKFTGFNGFLTLPFDKECRETHNFDIMEKDAFKKIFEDTGVSILYLNNYGIFDFRAIGNNMPIVRYMSMPIKSLQLVLNALHRLLFRERGIQNEFFSSNLICIGKKS